jgi:branched-chain amino acid transport system substrate-binding protein
LPKRNGDPTCIKDQLYKIKDYPGASGKTSFDENGDALKEIIIKTIKNGQFVPYKE